MLTGRRRAVARVVAALAAVFWGLLWFGLIDLLVVLDRDPGFEQDYLLESGWGLLYLVLVTVPLVVLVVRPGEPVAVAQLVVVTAAVLVGAAWRGSWPQLLNGLGLLATSAALAGLGGLQRWRRVRRGRLDLVLVVLALVGLPAAVRYGAPLIANTTVPEDVTNGVSHYPMQASLALAVVALAGLAALVPARLPGWTAAVCAAWLGVESIVYPDRPASLGTTGGALAVVWAVLVAVAVGRRRRTRASAAPPGSG